MPPQPSRKQFIAATVLLILAAIGIVGLILFQSLTFRLTGTIPRLGGKVATSTGTIKLSFNKKLDSSMDYTKTVVGTNKGLVKKIRVDSKNLLIDLGLLNAEQYYEFTIPQIRASSGQLINNYIVRFQAIYVTYDKISKEQRNFELSQVDREEDEQPILKYLPYQADQYYLTATFPLDASGQQVLHIDAQLFLRGPDLGSQRTTVINNLKQAIANYIRSKGLDPNKYIIDYTINEPPAIDH